MRNKFFLFVFMLTLADIIYQVSYKFMPEGVPATSAILALYAIALVEAIILAFILDKKFKINTQKNYIKNKVTYIMALTMVSIDFGYLFIYRFGGEISKVFNLTVPMQALFLMLAGILFYKEKITKYNIIGIILSVVGVILISS